MKPVHKYSYLQYGCTKRNRLFIVLLWNGLTIFLELSYAAIKNVYTVDERRSKKETVLHVLITICRPTGDKWHKSGDKWHSETLFLAIFDPRWLIVESVFDCRLSGVILLIFITERNTTEKMAKKSSQGTVKDIAWYRNPAKTRNSLRIRAVWSKVFARRSMCSQGHKDFSYKQWRLWSECVGAHGELCLRRADMPSSTFRCARLGFHMPHDKSNTVFYAPVLNWTSLDINPGQIIFFSQR